MPLSNDNQITMEKTPKYLIDPHVPRRVHLMNPEIKLVIVLRNPVTRAISEYVQSQWRKKRKVLESESAKQQKQVNHNQYTADANTFRQMLFKSNGSSSSSSSSGEIRADWTIVRNGMYIDSIRRWLALFPIEQMLFVNGERLISEPHVELDRVQRFLGLAPLIRQEHFVHDRRKGFACIIKPIDSRQVKCLNEQKGRRHPIIEPTVLDALHRFYRPYSAELFNLLNQPPWWPL
jgi:[heparan sulfate]-glucosamine 3-sulfotransferase 3